MPSDEDDAPEVLDFLRWFNQEDGTSLSTKVRLSDIHNAGRGLGTLSIVCICELSADFPALAVHDISQDEELFRIPRAFVLDCQTSTLRKHLPDELDALDPWTSLILVLIYESLRGQKSRWHPYLRILPEQFDTLMFWSKSELAELQASAIVTRIGKEDAEANFHSDLLPIIRAHPELFPLQSLNLEEEVVRLAHIAGSQVMAYAFDVEKQSDQDDSDSLVTDDDDNPAKGMVPLADMLNADAQKNNAHLIQEDDVFVMKSLTPILEGEEIFNDYGNLPRSDLLRRYGYVADSYKPFDIVEISLELIQDVAKSQGLTGKMIKKALMPINEIDALEDGYVLERSESCHIKDLIPTEMLMVIKALCKAARLQENGDGDDLRADGFYLSEVSFLHTLMVNRIASYPTSLAQDLALLKQPVHTSSSGAAGATGRRLKMALEVRIGEKEILDHTKTIAEEWIKAWTERVKDKGKKRKQPDRPEDPKANESSKFTKII